MDAVICFDPFRGVPLLHGNNFNLVAIIDVTDHYVRVSFAGSHRELSREVGVELTLIERVTQLKSVLARVYAVSIQNQITTTVP
jgi:hypothetical protein